VFIRKDPETGDVILSRKPGSWDDLFALADSVEIPADFLASRDRRPPQKTPPLLMGTTHAPFHAGAVS